MNPRLQSMREKVIGYNFKIEWNAGKTNLIADALSGTPKLNDDSTLENIPCNKI